MGDVLKIINKSDYNKLGILADVNLHDKVFEEFKTLKLNKKSKILILGAGKGVFDKKLLDLGYLNITAVDLNKKDYSLKSKVNFVKFDLNKDFSKKFKNYDVIFAMEIIEHLKSPLNFVKNCYASLNKKGIFIITTPNILEFSYRLKTTFRSELPSFNSQAMLSYGHILPILPHILEKFLLDYNFNILKKTYNRTFFDFLIVESWKSYLQFIIFSIIYLIFWLLNIKDKYPGVIRIYVAQKVDY